MYEAAGTIFMCDFVGEKELDPIRPCQLDGALKLWSEEAFLAPKKRYTFDVAIPVKVVDPKVAQKKDKVSSAVVMAHALPVLAGRAVLMAWYGAMQEALHKKDDELVFRLFGWAMDYRCCGRKHQNFLIGALPIVAVWRCGACP